MSPVILPSRFAKPLKSQKIALMPKNPIDNGCRNEYEPVPLKILQRPEKDKGGGRVDEFQIVVEKIFLVDERRPIFFFGLQDVV
jgi:hypothetical protein